jgi:hypothetical protein
MSKSLLNDPFALLSNQSLVQGAPFDAGSLRCFECSSMAEVKSK